jgi:hypothetical protein
MSARRRLRGSTIVEFALVLLLFLAFTLGVTDFSRLLFSWNAANDATRFGARFAAICDEGASADAVLSRMRGLLPNIATIDVQWSPAGCTPENCESVRVAVTGLQHHWLSPLPGIVAPLVLPLPGFGTTLTREAMRQDPNSASFCAP